MVVMSCCGVKRLLSGEAGTMAVSCGAGEGREEVDVLDWGRVGVFLEGGVEAMGKGSCEVVI